MGLLGTPQYIEDNITYETPTIADGLAEHAQSIYYREDDHFQSESIDELFHIPNHVRNKLSKIIDCNRDECVELMGALCIDGHLIGIDLTGLYRAHGGKHRITEFPDLNEFSGSLYFIIIPDHEISEIPRDLGDYPYLHTLSIPNNNITRFDSYIHDIFPNIQALHIQGNPIINHNNKQTNLSKIVLTMMESEIINISPNFIKEVSTEYLELYFVKCEIYDIHSGFLSLFNIIELSDERNTKYVGKNLIKLVSNADKIKGIKTLLTDTPVLLSDIDRLLQKHEHDIKYIGLEKLVVDKKISELERVTDTISWKTITYENSKSYLEKYVDRIRNMK